MSNNSPGWAVALVGEKFDLDDFRELLAVRGGPHPWMEDYTTGEGVAPLLRSASWERFTEASDVMRDAERMITRLNGAALLVHNDAKPVRLGGVHKFGPDGKRLTIMFVMPGHFQVTGGRARARMISGAPGLVGPVQPSLVQKWFTAAEMDETRADLLVQIARLDNWYDVYKSMELVERLAGTAFDTGLGREGKKEWKRIRQTANCYRHAPDPVKYPLPAVRAVLDDARAFILKVTPRFL